MENIKEKIKEVLGYLEILEKNCFTLMKYKSIAYHYSVELEFNRLKIVKEYEIYVKTNIDTLFNLIDKFNINKKQNRLAKIIISEIKNLYLINGEVSYSSIFPSICLYIESEANAKILTKIALLTDILNCDWI